MTYLWQLYRFLYDFLVGDAWELFVGPILAVILAAMLVTLGVEAAVSGAVLVIAVLVVGALHLVVALRGSA